MQFPLLEVESMDNLLKINNGQRVDRESIPHIPFAIFRQELVQFANEGGNIVQFFAYDDNGQSKLLAVLRNKTNDTLYVTGCDVEDSFSSLTIENEKFHMFEREIAEQYGLKPDGHPWLKMVRYHANYSRKPDVFGNNYNFDIPGNYPYFTVEGETVHEVAVGPVHAGIIEPGHFRFQCVGERVFHLEIQLGYQHRSVETLMQSVPAKRLPIIAETIAGDTTIGHNLCHCQAVEALAGLSVDEGQVLSGLLLLRWNALQIISAISAP